MVDPPAPLPSLDPPLAHPVLRGRHVVLEPLTLRHLDDLWAAARDGDTWRYMTERVASRADMAGWIERRLQHTKRTSLPYAQVDAHTGRAFGATMLFDIHPVHRRMEIGFTWIAPDHRGGRANAEAKFLLLAHAFDTLGALRVQSKTDTRNSAAIRALIKLGFREEGTLRSYNLMPDGHRRDAVFFSVLDREWPIVRRHLEALIAADLPGPPTADGPRPAPHPL